jgi:hypothetical protein
MSLHHVSYLALLTMSVIAGCGPRYTVVAGSGPREPVPVETVIIYQEFPRKFERLGTLEVVITPSLALNARGHADAMFVELKTRAAKLGADGVLLAIDDLKRFDYLVLAGYYSRFYYVSMRDKPQTAIAEAIHVVEQ